MPNGKEKAPSTLASDGAGSECGTRDSCGQGGPLPPPVAVQRYGSKPRLSTASPQKTQTQLNGVLGGLQHTLAALVSQSPERRTDLLAAMVCLWSHADRRGLCFPGRVRISRETGLTLKRVTWALQRLQALGIIALVEQTAHEKQGKNAHKRYRIKAHYRVISEKQVGTHRPYQVGTHRPPNKYQYEACVPPAESAIGNTDAGSQAALVPSSPEPAGAGPSDDAVHIERHDRMSDEDADFIFGAAGAYYKPDSMGLTKGLRKPDADKLRDASFQEHMRSVLSRRWRHEQSNTSARTGTHTTSSARCGVGFAGCIVSRSDCIAPVWNCPRAWVATGEGNAGTGVRVCDRVRDAREFGNMTRHSEGGSKERDK